MPENVPTSAAPIRPPRISGDESSEPIAWTMPSTAATMPSAGRLSAMFCSAWTGL